LRVYEGPVAQPDNRLIVGPIGAAAPPAGAPVPIEPRWVVVSGRPGAASEGRAGVNTLDPKAALEVKGNWTANEDGALRLSGTSPTIRFEDAQAVWRQQVGAASAGSFRIGHRIGTAAGPAAGPPTWKDVVYVTTTNRVGIQTGTPQAPLSVRGEAGTWEEIVSFEDSGGAPKWRIQMHTVGGKHLHIGEQGIAAPRLYLKAGGDVGIGTAMPSGRMTVEGKTGQDRFTFFPRPGEVEYTGGNSGLFVFRDTGGLTAFMGTKFGIDTTAPRARLEVAGAADTWGTAAFTPDPAKGGFISHVHWDTDGDWYIRSASANGKVVIQDTGGNVGIGTSSPQEKLHVAGNFLRVEGAGGEQAYIGGDGSFNFFGQDVQIGSSKPGLTEVHFWNPADSNWMWVTFSGFDLGSDARLKSGIRPLTGALDQVVRLRGVRFQWKQPPGSTAPPRNAIGVIAQEVAEVAPELVRSARGYLTVSYSELTPLLIESVKELKAEIDRLNDRVAALETGPRGKSRPARARKAAKR
jgi:hypothetical protein